MDKTNFVVFLVAALLIGGLIGAVGFASNTESVVIKEVPVTNTIETIKEVPVEVEVLVTDQTLLNQSVSEVLSYLEDEELLTCDGNEYESDELALSKVYDEYSVAYDDEDRTVTGSLKLKYNEGDFRSCRETYDFEVFYEEDEDAEVSILA